MIFAFMYHTFLQDISFSNELAILNTIYGTLTPLYLWDLIFTIIVSRSHPTVKPLVCTVRLWAVAQGLSTLSSYALTNLVVAFLQHQGILKSLQRAVQHCPHCLATRMQDSSAQPTQPSTGCVAKSMAGEVYREMTSSGDSVHKRLRLDERELLIGKSSDSCMPSDIAMTDPIPRLTALVAGSSPLFEESIGLDRQESPLELPTAAKTLSMEWDCR